MLRTASLDGDGYLFEVLGVADDVAEADGKEILTYSQALAAALGRRSTDPNKITVPDALTAWARHKCQSASSAKQVLDVESAARRIAAAFQRKTLRSITAGDIARWMEAIVAEGPDARARRSTANRRLANLKAALTCAADLNSSTKGRAHGRRLRSSARPTASVPAW